MIWNNFSKLTNFHLNKTVLLILTYNIASMFSEWHFLGNLCRNIFTLGNFTPDLCTTFSDHNLSLSQIEVSWSRCRLVYSKLPLRLAGIFQTKENHIPPKMGFSKDEVFLKPFSEIQNFITLYILILSLKLGEIYWHFTRKINCLSLKKSTYWLVNNFQDFLRFSCQSPRNWVTMSHQISYDVTGPPPPPVREGVSFRWCNLPGEVFHPPVDREQEWGRGSRQLATD